MVQGWVVEAGLAVPPVGTLLTAAVSCCQGRWDALFPKMLIPILSRCCRVILPYVWNSGTEKSRRQVRMCLLPSLQPINQHG